MGPMHHPTWFTGAAEAVSMGIEGIGILIILLGGIGSLAGYVRDALHHTATGAYQQLRRRLGRAILLGLEFLVAADIIGTVLVDPTLNSALALGLIVLIRTFLSWSLEVEIEGRWPWQAAPSPEKTPAEFAPPKGGPAV